MCEHMIHSGYISVEFFCKGSNFDLFEFFNECRIRYKVESFDYKCNIVSVQLSINWMITDAIAISLDTRHEFACYVVQTHKENSMHLSAKAQRAI